MKNNHRPSLARPRNPSSKLVPSSATKSTRLCRIRPEPDDRGRSSRLVNSATAPWSRGARPPRVHQHEPPRAELKKNAAAGRWNFRHVGREAHPTAPVGRRAPRDHARKAQYFKNPPHLERLHNPSSKLVPSSATESTRLAASDPSLTTEAGVIAPRQ